MKLLKCLIRTLCPMRTNTLTLRRQLVRNVRIRAKRYQRGKEQEAKFIKELEQEAQSKTSFLSRFEDSAFKSLKEAQDVKREVLKVGSEIVRGAYQGS